jgi:hypothetical protein
MPPNPSMPPIFQSSPDMSMPSMSYGQPVSAPRNRQGLWIAIAVVAIAGLAALGVVLAMS